MCLGSDSSGHRLVADDMVHIQKRSPSSVIGSGFEVSNTTWKSGDWGSSIFGASLGWRPSVKRRRSSSFLGADGVGYSPEYDRLGFEEKNFPFWTSNFRC